MEAGLERELSLVVWRGLMRVGGTGLLVPSFGRVEEGSLKNLVMLINEVYGKCEIFYLTREISLNRLYLPEISALFSFFEGLYEIVYMLGTLNPRSSRSDSLNFHRSFCRCSSFANSCTSLIFAIAS